jgi:hypothetical protein
MQKHSIEGLSKEDARTLFSKMHLHAANLRGLINTHKGRYVCPPTFSGTGDVSIDLRILEAHCTECETELGDKAPQFQFSAGVQPSGTRSAVSPGNSPGHRVFTPGAVNSPGKKPTLTEQLLKLRGVTTLEELNKLPPPAGTLD